jgi:SPP1 family predicted phage head-tail adaptor|tara:strand:- start:626 stop:964 length:339 start_codon:yes stop_codon:yes gene_type:complete
MASSGASIGAMRKSVVIQSVASTTDSGGGRGVVWSTYKTLLAHVQQQSASSKYTQGVIDEKGLYVFTMRYVTGITNSHRISYNSKLFNITSVINLDERNKYMVIKAMEGVAT